MGSRLHGVPISTTQMAPKAAPPYNKASSGIRAPLTVDESDFEFSASSKSHRNSTTSSYYSGSELESEGFESGEDEFETTSERPYVTDQDDAILEETHYIKKYAFSRPVSENPNGERVERSSYSYEEGFFRPSVKNPDGEIVKRCGNITGNVLPRPFVRNPDEWNYKGYSNVNENNVSRPFLSDSDEEVFEDDNYEDGDCVLKNGDSIPVVAVVDEEVSECESSSVVDIGSSLIPRSRMPIAKISRDSDDESQGSEVLDDYSFSTVARVPSIEVLQKLNSAPKVRMLKVEEGEDSGSLAANMAENEVIEDSVASNGFLGCRNEEESIGVQGTVRTVLSADIFHNKDPDSNGLVRANSLISKEEQNSVSESERNRDLIFLNEEIQEADVMLDKRKCVHLVNYGRPTDFAEDIILPGCSCVVTAAEPRCPCETVKLTEFEVSELKSIGDLVPLSMDNHVFDLSIESNEVERKSEQKIDKTVETSQGETLDQGVQNEEEPNWGCPQFSELPEVVINSKHGDMYYSLLKNDCSIGNSNTCPSVLTDTKLDREAKYIAENSELLPGEAENLIFQADAKAATLAEIEEQVFTSLSCGEILQDNAQEIDAQLVMDLEEANADDEIGDRRQTIDSAALDAFLKADRGAVSDSNTVKFTSVDGTDEFSLKTSSADLNSIFHSTKPITETRNADQFAPPRANGEFEEAFSEGQKQQLEKIQQIRVKYLQLLHRLGRSPEDSVAANVLYQLVITEERFISQASRLDSDKKAAIELEVLTKNDLNFTLSILVIGKTGVGKSATINSIFGERKTKIDAFEPSTTEAKEIVGMVAGVKVKVFDTPGLRTRIDHSHNRKVLFSIKKLIQRSPPDVVLYIDRLDTQINNLDDLPVLKLVSTYLGPSIWRKAIIILTHATSIPPDGPNGYPLTYEVFVARRSRVVQQLISHSAGELLLMNPGLSFPVALAENHPFAEKNELGEKLLHNGESWRSQLLHLCCSMKIFSELNSVVEVQNPLDHTKLFGFKICSPWLPYFLSSSMESTVHPKLSNDLGGENVDSATERGYSTDSDLEDGEYDKLPPPFQPLKKSEVAKLSKGHGKAYFEEYDYRIELLEKKQWREDARRLRYMKKIESCGSNDTYVDQETGSTETVAAPLPDMALPPSFDGENPSFRYRALESSSNLFVRPVFNSHGWDHDFGYDGVVIEDKFAIASQFPPGISVQITKDKKECSIQLHSSVSAKHEDKGSTMTGPGIQSIGKQVPYILKGESKIMNFKMNRTAAGISITFLGDKIISGLEVEDQITVGKWLTFTGNAGVIRPQDDAAHGANLEVDLKKKNYTTPHGQSSLGLSTMKWRGNLIWGCNLQSKFSVGRNYKLHIQAGLNNKPSGKITVRASSSDQLQIAVIALLPIAKTIFRNIFPQANENYSI